MFETRQPSVLGNIGRLSTSRGDVLVVLTENPEILPVSQLRTYVVLADWLPREEPVVMFVTTNFRDNGEREVHLVYRSKGVAHVAGQDGDSGSIAVQVGRWLFDNHYLTVHSPSRNPAGERWAAHVGGVRPPIDHRGASPEDSGQRASRAWSALCGNDWSDWLPLT